MVAPSLAAAKKALVFAWIKGGWDENRDGVAEGVQHNTYDVEFYGPNPLCGIWYLGALRAGEEMARAVGDSASAQEYRRLFENGKNWIDANLFNGEYYVQKVVGRRLEDIAKGLTGGSGAADPMAPDYQMGEACLVDQLLGQYMAHVCGLGYLLDPAHVRETLKSIFKYNYRADLSEHEAVQRVYALNDDAGVLVASYPSGKRPQIPFPYFAEVWSGLEYQLAAHLLFEDMPAGALTVVEAVRQRHDGERRNPWDEPECGHHYARAMSSPDISQKDGKGPQLLA
jgi:non-lysosomal glucosylceramidase